MARIRLEDLDRLGEEEEEEDEGRGGEDEEEKEEDEEQRGRLFAHWEAVANTHRVSLPPVRGGGLRGAALPSREVGVRHQGGAPLRAEHLPELHEAHALHLQGELCRCVQAGGWQVAQREGPASSHPSHPARWLPCCLPPGRYLGMTVPVLNEIHLNEEGTELEREVLTAYYLPGQFQQNPPVPMDPEIHVTERAPLRVITRVFYGITTEETILREIGLFWELLGSTDAVLRETYIVATYQNPSVPQCRNEIWFIRRAE
uniref:Heme-binding protein 1 n=1 Tax=Cairina moschata TaxID=8855 RepID=A0A8C3CRR3_CAIMO